MSKEFYTQTIKTEYEFDELYIGCIKTVKLFFKNNMAVLEGIGESWQEKQDPYDEVLGKAFALTRANKDIDNQIENYLIKYSCKPTNSKLDSIEAKLTLNTKSFDKNLGKLSKDVDKLIEKLNIANNRINCKIFGEDGFISNLRIDVAEPEGTTLDKLVGKWAIRTKAPKDKEWDNSYIDNPIFVIEASDKIAKYYFKRKDRNPWFFGGSSGFDDALFLDNNWIEYKKEKTLKEKALDLIDKGYNLVPLCSKDHQGMNVAHMNKCSTPGKSVLVKNWELDNYISSKEDIESWFRVNSHIGIGIKVINVKNEKSYEEVI